MILLLLLFPFAAGVWVGEYRSRRLLDKALRANTNTRQQIAKWNAAISERRPVR